MNAKPERPIPKAGDPIDKYLRDLHASEGWEHPCECTCHDVPGVQHTKPCCDKPAMTWDRLRELDNWANEGGHLPPTEGDE